MKKRKNMALLTQGEVVRSKVIARAVYFSREEHRTVQQMMSRAEMVEELIADMQHQVMEFAYINPQGDRCVMRGTLEPYAAWFGAPYRSCPTNCFVVCYDVNVNEWRTFHAVGLREVI